MASLPLATRIFPHIVGQEYIDWFLIESVVIDSVQLAKYGAFLIVYLVVGCGLLTAFVAGVVSALRK